MKECGFCFQQAPKLTGEHIFSDWMNKIFTEPWERTVTNADGRVFTYGAANLNWKEKVVCEQCNSGWMSDIENDHAEPTLTPLIVGDILIPITPAKAKSIAIFAFKTAAVLDLMAEKQRHEEPFFSRRIRSSFRRHLTIPPKVWMWMCPYIATHYRADSLVVYSKGELPFIGPVQFYICTYAIGHFVFQVLSLKSIDVRSGFFPGDTTFNDLAVQFWPNIDPGFTWPKRGRALRSVEELQKFHRRWEGVFPLIR